MTSLERPLPLPLVVVILSAVSVGGFVFGLKGALDKTDHQAVSTAPLAEVSGVPVRDATPAVAEIAPPPAPVVEKPKPVEEVAETPAEEAPVVETPPATPAPVEKKPEPPPAQATPQRIEDLY
jgi:outer membrane biosynthesis protein TonB